MPRRVVKDFLFYKAKREHYAARSIYKLKEMNKKYRLLKEGNVILDLGCYPGSWLQHCSQVAGPTGMVLGIDRKELTHKVADNVRFLKADVLDLNLEDIKEIAQEFDVVLSDMAPSTMGIRSVDHQRSLVLARRCLEIARHVLKSKGNLACKIFEGEDSPGFFAEVKRWFEFAKIYKPSSSRKESREIYVIGLRKK
jgi:23S rRNA (uridine2552-2'-O)-methyltransferase